MRPRLVLTDIEGTTTPISFVHQALFPYGRAALPSLIRDRADEPEVAEALAAIARAAPGADPLEQCLAWMNEDAKVTPLKQLQGIAWREGYRSGALQSELYGDVPPALRAWQAAGVRLAVYSSGSEAAQRLIFAHAAQGDLTGLFDAFLDTRIGGKREAASYTRAAGALGLPPADILFLSDMAAELDAAAAGGLRTCQLLRAGDFTEPSPAHLQAPDFPAVARLFGLPTLAAPARA